MAIVQYCLHTACLSSPPAAVRGARLDSEAGGSFELGALLGRWRAVVLPPGLVQITGVVVGNPRVHNCDCTARICGRREGRLLLCS